MSKKILIVLNYYVPYVSGVTEYARLEAEMLVKSGYEVFVLCSNHANLPAYEVINGVHVYRAKVLCKISKGTVSLEFIKLACRLAKLVDVVNLHCPMLESGMLSCLISKEKLVTTYHCDINLPRTLLNGFIVTVMDISHKVCLNRSRDIVVTTIDYASHSRVASAFVDKMTEIAACTKEYYPQSVTKSQDVKIIGFCGRIVEEKGIDVLLKAYQILKMKDDKIVLKIAGDYKSIAGGSIYPKLARYIKDNNIKGVEFLGQVPEDKMAHFFSSLDVFVLPSINSLEAFGMVQIEAMRCGVPVVSSDLYGVRTIVNNTKAGVVSKRGDYEDLANCIQTVLDNKQRYVKSITEIEKYYSNDMWAKKYKEILFK